ncbi:MAG: hypothetical protein KGL39_48380 [Patescibacteria group bacterium]|nr:hypothetical protein [Patescibacteria group bacterium]
MATADQITLGLRGAGRYRMMRRSTLSLVSGHVGVTGFGAITGGSGGANGSYPLVLTGGTQGAAPASGIVTVAGGAITGIVVTTPGDYTVAPTGISTANIPGLTGASVASVTTLAVAMDRWSPPLNTRIIGVRLITPVAFSGTPTNINVCVGNALGDASYMANTDAKAQGVVDGVLVGAALATICVDGWSGPLVISLLNNGGTSPVGTVYAEVDYLAVNP